MLCTMSGSNRFNSSRKKCAVAFALAITLTQTAPAQQYTCHGPGFPPYNSAPFEGLHSVRYAAYIPFDHLTGATPCFNSGLGSILKDLQRGPERDHSELSYSVSPSVSLSRIYRRHRHGRPT